MRTRFFRSLFLLPLLVAATAVPAPAVVITPGLESHYVVGPSIALPDVNSADLVVVGASLFVGQGAFGAGLQSILRIDPDGTTTTVVNGLNAIGGLAYDGLGDRLLFTDNGGTLVGATSGDTVYALPNPRSVAAPVAAATLTLVASGSIPFAQAVLPWSGSDVLVGDPAGPGVGRVVKVSGGVVTDFITGLDYTAGLTSVVNYVAPPLLPQLFVGNVDGSFVGSVKRYTPAGVLIGTVNNPPLSGALDQEADTPGNVYVTGGFTNDFMSSTVVLVAQAGSVNEIASGFGFSSGIAVDAPSQRILVLDFGATHVDTILDVLRLAPGGRGKNDCQIETWGSPRDVSSNGAVHDTWTCTDGDPACDRDLVANGSCQFQLGACVSVKDSLRNAKCTPVDIDSVTISSKKLPGAVSPLQTAIDAVLPATVPTCGEGSIVTVPANRKTHSIKLDAFSAGKRVDRDVQKMRCLP